MQNPKRKRDLVDNLIVVGVCGIVLVAVFIAPLFGSSGKYPSRSQRTKSLIHRISFASMIYQNDLQSYPPDTSRDPESIFKYLGQSIARSGGDPYGPVLAFDVHDLDQNAKSHIVIDRWGHPIVYISDPAKVVHNKGGVDIYSLGPDGQTPADAPGTGADDINNWDDNTK